MTRTIWLRNKGTLIRLYRRRSDLRRQRARLVVEIAAIDLLMARVDGDVHKIAAATVAVRKSYEHALNIGAPMIRGMPA